MFDWLFGRKKEPEQVEQQQPFDKLRTGPFDKLRTGPDADTTTPSVVTECLESQMDSLNQRVAGWRDWAEALQDQLDRLDDRVAFGNDQLEALTQHLPDVADWAGPLDRRLAELATWAEQTREGLTQLEEGIRKLSRSQFKTNSLAEAQQERLQAALETLQDLAIRKQEAAERAQQRQREAVEVARREARVAMTVDLFPALDGLESALESGHALLDRSRLPAAKPGFVTRLAYAFGLRDLPMTYRQTQDAAGGESQALAAWLDGLELIRERFLALLQAEGIQPIRAEGEPFDPHRHVAVAAVERSHVPPGTVIEEHRPGYRLGDRVLRYAEVVVARDGREPQYEGPERPHEPIVEGLEETEKPKEPEEARGPWEPAVEEREGVQASDELAAETPAGVREPKEPEEARGPWEPAVEEREGVQASDELAAETPAGVREPKEPELQEDGPFDEAQDRPVGGVKEDTSSQHDKDDARTIDPEIEEMIARFEARQRTRRS